MSNQTSLADLLREADSLRDRWPLKWEERDELVQSVRILIRRARNLGLREALQVIDQRIENVNAADVRAWVEVTTRNAPEDSKR